jgi:hypothetical protein
VSASFVAAASCGLCLYLSWPLCAEPRLDDGRHGAPDGRLVAVFIFLGGVPVGVVRMPRSVEEPVVAIGWPICSASTLVAERMLGGGYGGV